MPLKHGGPITDETAFDVAVFFGDVDAGGVRACNLFNASDESVDGEQPEVGSLPKTRDVYRQTILDQEHEEFAVVRRRIDAGNCAIRYGRDYPGVSTSDMIHSHWEMVAENPFEPAYRFMEHLAEGGQFHIGDGTRPHRFPVPGTGGGGAAAGEEHDVVPQARARAPAHAERAVRRRRGRDDRGLRRRRLDPAAPQRLPDPLRLRAGIRHDDRRVPVVGPGTSARGDRGPALLGEPGPAARHRVPGVGCVAHRHRHGELERLRLVAVLDRVRLGAGARRPVSRPCASTGDPVPGREQVAINGRENVPAVGDQSPGELGRPGHRRLAHVP